ncbi:MULTISPECIES: hypothetical protein [unclassified Micromonospora]|uniref:hypothetical protein n=1 Tax=unclassified Micromonospora TaxID=2617518 RepID=UPI003A839FDF
MADLDKLRRAAGGQATEMVRGLGTPVAAKSPPGAVRLLRVAGEITPLQVETRTEPCVGHTELAICALHVHVEMPDREQDTDGGWSRATRRSWISLRSEYP